MKKITTHAKTLLFHSFSLYLSLSLFFWFLYWKKKTKKLWTFFTALFLSIIKYFFNFFFSNTFFLAHFCFRRRSTKHSFRSATYWHTKQLAKLSVCMCFLCFVSSLVPAYMSRLLFADQSKASWWCDQDWALQIHRLHQRNAIQKISKCSHFICFCGIPFDIYIF